MPRQHSGARVIVIVCCIKMLGSSVYCNQYYSTRVWAHNKDKYGVEGYSDECNLTNVKGLTLVFMSLNDPKAVSLSTGFGNK